MADIDTGAWDGPAAMSRAASSDDPAAAYRAICAGRRDGDPAVQSTWALPHHANPGDPPNADGVRNGLSRLSQTEDLTNADEAQSHLDAHMAVISPEAEREIVITAIPGSELTVRSVDKREIVARIVPWDVVVETPIGLETFKRGAFSHIDPRQVVLRLGHEGEPVGVGLSLDERDDGAHMAFRVSKTQRGDDALTLAADGVTRHVSVEYAPRESEGEVVYRNRQRVTEFHKVALKGVATTYAPAYPQAEILAVREAQGVAPMAETEAPPVGAVTTPEPDYTALVDRLTTRMSEPFDKIVDRLAKLEERSRMEIVIPSGPPAPDKPDRGIWMQAVLRMLSGERIPDLQLRTLDDLITSDNIGVVPPAYSSEIIGVINRRRPFMETTRRLTTPTSGMSLVVPRIVTRPSVAQQMTEKAELDSTATAIDTVTFDAVTKGGAGDISLQLLKRSSPSFLGLYLELLAEAYAIEAEAEAVEALIDSGSGGFGSLGGVNDGGDFDPEDPTFGDAWLNGYNAMYGGPDTIWLSSAAVAAFIDAKANTTNLPLYSSLVANFTAAGGVGGVISGLRPVHTPALNGTAVDVLVGPSAGFAWAEDGTYTLQVDVPAKAGRDVAMVGILWFAPLYPTAFTGWALAGS